MGKKDFKYFIAYNSKNEKFQKWGDMLNVLMKLSLSPFWLKSKKHIRRYGIRSAIKWKNFIVNQCIIKNI